MISAKQVLKFSQNIEVLYVEDDATLREETQKLLEPFFKRLDVAEDGKAGLDKYNGHFYDIIITDINMPRMNGIEMITQIHAINIDQKVIAISAHNDSDILINLIRSGVSSFMLKPVIQQDLLNTLYPVCRDAHAQKMNIELFHELNAERDKLSKQVRKLAAHLNSITVKNQQVEDLMCKQQPEKCQSLMSDYFAGDEEDNVKKVLFMGDDCDEMAETFSEITDYLALYSEHPDRSYIEKVGGAFRKISNILLHYTPFMDPLAKSMEDLSLTILDDIDKFMELFDSSSQHILMLFDAISIDMERYMSRFSAESMAMKNIHHIHMPTSISIQQVITLIRPEEAEDGDIDFFI